MEARAMTPKIGAPSGGPCADVDTWRPGGSAHSRLRAV